MRPTIAFVAAATLAAALVPPGSEELLAQEQGTGLAPEIRINEWIRGNGLTELADYRGQVVLLEFWQTH